MFLNCVNFKKREPLLKLLILGALYQFLSKRTKTSIFRCGKCKCNQVLVVEDNCCSCHTTAFVLSAEIENTDLFFVSFRNRLYQVPFVVLTDHKTSSIIITIRGSMSLLDIVTDLMLNDAVFSVDVDTDDILRQDETLDTEGEVRVHLGMLKSARYVYNTLQKHNVLEDLFMLNPGYNLIVTGHSLGAGVASLLTLLLKQTYPTVRCYAFSPPGCIISKNGQAEMEQHVLGIIVGDDLVPRTSYQVFVLVEKLTIFSPCSGSKWHWIERFIPQIWRSLKL